MVQDALERWGAESEGVPTAEVARELLDRAMRELSAEEQLVLTLLEIEDRSVKETARLTGWSGVLVRVRAHRARKKLAQAVARLRGEEP